MKEKVLLLGLSTGGPAHLNRILSHANRLKSHIIIAQHMKEDVIDFFVNDLKTSFNLVVTSTPVTLNLKKRVVICGKSAFISKADNRHIYIDCKSNSGKFTPDIDVLFSSAVKLCKHYRVYVALLTGIGDDGVKGMLELKRHGAITIAESEESAPVFGMPRCAIEKGAADHIFSLDDMISFFVSEGLIDV